MAAYYSEWDARTAAWLRELIARGLLPAGEVDTRSIADVTPDDLAGFRQCHFFAGIGGWPYALRLAGWPDDRPVWTGSCPCQPFSNAGQQRGYDDDRHLAPVWLALIAKCRPPVVFGEQVASAAGRGWLSDLRVEMEALGYAVGAADLCSAGYYGAHIRQRLYFGARRMADADDARSQGRRIGGNGADQRALGAPGLACRLADASGPREFGWRVRLPGEGDHAGNEPPHERPSGLRASRRLADADGGQPRHGHLQPGGQHGQQPPDGGAGGVEHANGAGRAEGRAGAGGGQATRCSGAGRPRPPAQGWHDADWLYCRDAKWRPVGPGTFPLANAVSSRMVRLRGYGNAIDPELAAQFIGAWGEAVTEAA